MSLKPKKREQFQELHQAEFILFAAAKNYLGELKKVGDKIEPKKWQKDIEKLTNEKDSQYRQMKKMREKIKEIEQQTKAAEQQIQIMQNQQREENLLI